MHLRWTRLPFRFDPAPLAREVEALPAAAWTSHFNPHDFHGHWSGVALRSPSGRAEDILASSAAGGFHDTPLLAQSPALRSVVEHFHFPLRAVRLLRLHAGSRILEHRDHDLGLDDGQLRIHVPILTSDAVEFIVSNRRLRLRAGESWFIDFSQPHRIFNPGPADRVHLVLDGDLNPWARDLLERSAREIPTETELPAALAAFEHFRDAVTADSALAAHLQSFTTAASFLPAATAAAQQLGLALTEDDLRSLLRQHREEWNSRTASL